MDIFEQRFKVLEYYKFLASASLAIVVLGIFEIASLNKDDILTQWQLYNALWSYIAALIFSGALLFLEFIVRAILGSQSFQVELQLSSRRWFDWVFVGLTTLAGFCAILGLCLRLAYIWIVYGVVLGGCTILAAIALYVVVKTVQNSIEQIKADIQQTEAQNKNTPTSLREIGVGIIGVMSILIVGVIANLRKE